MCIRDRIDPDPLIVNVPETMLEKQVNVFVPPIVKVLFISCLLYTSDAADERSSVDLGGRRIIKKKSR